MKIRMKDVLRELDRRENVRFGDSNKESFRDIWQDLKSWKYQVGALESEARRNIRSSINGIDPKYGKNLNYAIEEIFKDSARLEDSIKKVMDKISFTINQMK